MSCPLIGLPYGEQLRRKRQRLLAALEGAGARPRADVLEVVGSPRVFQYRTQAKLVVRRAKRGVLIGVYRPGTHQVFDISQCAVHHPLINQMLAGLRAEIEARELSVYDERTRRGLVRYAVGRVSGWQKRVQLILVTAEEPVPRARELARSLRRRVRGLDGVVQNVNAEAGNVVLGSRYVLWAGDGVLTERVGDLKLQSRPGAFLQANVPVARRVYERAASWAAVGRDEVAVDLYCGVGGLTFHLAREARRVVGIEESPAAVLDAQVNVRLNGFPNVRIRKGNAGEVLPALRSRLGRIDVVALNPPRGGADEATREAIAACEPRRIVYVSCEPVTLARDLAWLSSRGYGLARVQPFDMFPQTEHVETVALLERAD